VTGVTRAFHLEFEREGWVDDTFGGTNRPCLLDENLRRKPAYEGFRAGLTNFD
jgi:hypothetical protein